ncbi:hypothetical protein MCOR25_005147 [Pyricularia grisea]|uniref:Uncharacterized protein n=1 Tax=Pyricularia grisea TaxID=148305 RepID=A0A6P8BKN4_PYRGI|nr:uncharacterized protein PgNI_01444 [Pyricularia grisea]KAI6366330.1 hypothetical protein MCOR25_005147 [Pyricularia grisea]TLD17254.1 hypothetical protein PgNI_01444 [Pyricularia grisea]
MHPYVVITALLTIAQAHMYLQQPAALSYKGNPNTLEKDIDYSLTSPLGGAEAFPCKGTTKLLGTPSGASVATWQAGSSQEMVIVGGARHDGGSCQASLSYDGGKSWKVIHSWVGDCPPASGKALSFKVPSDAPSGTKVLFAWSWINHTGSREFYMNCAVVNIQGGGGGEPVAFNSRPDLLVVNLGNGCTAKEGIDVDFPNPGPSITRVGNSAAPPSGNCGPSGPKPPAQGGGGNPPVPVQGDPSGNAPYTSPGTGSGPSGGKGDPSSPGAGQQPGPPQGQSAGSAGYTPGNDWPADFNPWGDASELSISAVLAYGLPALAAAAWVI